MISRLVGRNIPVDISMWMPIANYKPQVGDLIIWHGWLVSHWYGIITDIDADNNIKVIQAGIPALLFDDKKKYKVIKIDDIITSSGGEYAVLRPHNNQHLWFVS